MNTPLDGYVSALKALNEDDRLRGLKPRKGTDFASNDYLALASAPRMKKALFTALDAGTPIGAGGSRLLRGNCEEHEALEADAARFFRTETALFFGGGYIANFAVLTTLPQEGDLLVLDALVHASIHEGARASRAEFRISAHNDPQSIEDTIGDWRARGGKGRVWIVVESLYSMDGDFAPLTDLVAIAERHEAFLVVDEAHATGVYGEQGRGLTAPYEGRENLLVIHTCGKALGAAGALVTASGVLRDFMVNRCRPFIFATAPSPLMAVAVREAILILQEEPDRQRHLIDLIDFAHRQFAVCGRASSSNSQIVPYVVGDNARAMRLASALQARGFDIRGIRPPTVPVGTARLRISLTLNVGQDDVSDMIDALVEETWGDVQ
ncbi:MULTISPECIES: 8-amino-7-oxononanoate synthase [Bradyrhizobium]|jgi:8-amino-7-oxononanoate synthase|uniref:8-amino-7-oxononanoate synthase n=1 Tax=Bradyrhizobium elkanii TaxID=29448 RepID=A0A4Y3ZV80_BRAEL|nr:MULTISPECIES: 8-amino-7-oxononanoate synthase [Bradyrhizobium]MBP1299617.1 8-amino-7-oxononanoate synthase [Bradyrhizobium elkanii]MBP2428671.1 8-amino-7-oxononanoate synthase [Bradyrhizobium elkanii]MCP1729104.1 8-amino-7-oxononanoate synthase [Bradyrhizobium elkanii]MCP1755848.1 8-amino-7-oxononanoate synthase [Bradyrhizobium elkanii]MCP1929523.1 8-amino-7-oxononanoate synthase [Bradyrhizobium elkanii]